MNRVWESFLTEDDRALTRSRSLRVPHGPGRVNALLVIDMQVTAIGEDRPIVEQLDRFPGACGPHAWRAIPVQQRLLEAARRVGMPVIYSKHVFHPYTGLAKSASGVFAASDPRSEIQAEVAMQAGDILLEKQTPSCFTFTNLHMILQELGVDGLLTVGNSTSGCVRATCVEGEAMGYKMMVVEEAVFDRIEMSHAAALFDMQFKICDVIDEAAAMALIAGPAAVQKTA
ncbi:isochorismatase family protein [Pseudooceanicola sediminis]|uniref:Isochorismatase family protein n=1 Tax=Pseudooceanicola sediminis TaxID=2211117 RepID=A0A399J5Q4_9RHOB|nr:isochorismatase family protein [Pseudooceanicola sediminis]KAA2317305.1 isochorismatase family protein [Puniceibacterium sp. HSS470]RII39659.1 isochorismatase family protein [Pseudooceanicola sediminis]|tara:strand:- start:42000 stop:42686 length:687 start_codon:yes stop_codon:yes gene_type:complete